MTGKARDRVPSWRPWRLGGEGRWLLTAALAVSASCAYTFEPSLPAHIRSVRVEVFENRTGYPGLEAALAKALVREFQADGTVVPASRLADSALTGRIVSVGRSALQEDEYDDVVTGQVTLVAVVTFRDTSRDEADGKVLLGNERVTSRELGDSAGVFRLKLGETEAGARAGAVTELARNIVRRVVEVW